MSAKQLLILKMNLQFKAILIKNILNLDLKNAKNTPSRYS